MAVSVVPLLMATVASPCAAVADAVKLDTEFPTVAVYLVTAVEKLGDREIALPAAISTRDMALNWLSAEAALCTVTVVELVVDNGLDHALREVLAEELVLEGLVVGPLELLELGLSGLLQDLLDGSLLLDLGREELD